LWDTVVGIDTCPVGGWGGNWELTPPLLEEPMPPLLEELTPPLLDELVVPLEVAQV
jgi:hypothetical protein